MKNELKVYVFLSLTIGILLMLQTKNPGPANSGVSMLPDINKVVVNIPCNVYIQQGKEQKMFIEQNGSVLQDIKTRIEDQILIIDGTLLSNFYQQIKTYGSKKPEINIYISLKDIKGLKLCDYCKISTSGSINENQLKLAVQDGGVMILINKNA